MLLERVEAECSMRTKPGIAPKMGQLRAGPFEARQAHASGALAIEKGAAAGRASTRSASPLFEQLALRLEARALKALLWGRLPLYWGCMPQVALPFLGFSIWRMKAQCHRHASSC